MPGKAKEKDRNQQRSGPPTFATNRTYKNDEPNDDPGDAVHAVVVDVFVDDLQLKKGRRRMRGISAALSRVTGRAGTHKVTSNA
jgi:hypothetical protein